MYEKAIRILLLEDSLTDAELAIRELRRLDPKPTVIHVSDGISFEKALKDNFDLILSDFNLPGFGGIEALSMVQDLSPEVPLIFLSGTIGEEQAVDLILRGATDYVLKDRIRKLVPSVERALHQREDQRRSQDLQKKLREAESRYNSLFDLSLDGIYLHDFNGLFLDANNSALEMLGYTVDELRHLHITDIAEDVEQRILIEESIREILDTGRQKTVREFKLKRQDGRTLWVEVAGSMVLSQGNPVAIQGIVRDITDRRLRDMEIRKLFLTVENSRDLIMIADSSGRIEYVNHATIELTGYSKFELIGQTPAIMKSGMHSNEFYQELWDIIKSGRAFTSIFIDRKKSGELLYLLQTITPLTDDSGQISHFITTAKDITAQRGMEDRINHMAWFDSLTDLPNRYALIKYISERLQLEGCENCTLIFLDIDRHNRINQIAGYETGDEILKAFAGILKEAAAGDSIVARVGSDEFAMLVPGRTDPRLLHELLGSVRQTLRTPITATGHEYMITFSAGIALSPEHGDQPEKLIRNAQQAMIEARNNGRNTHAFYSQLPAEITPEVLTIEQKLYRALENQEFFIAYQPYWRTGSGELAGLEALLRWQNPELGPVAPGVFIPLLEDTGMILDVGKFILSAVCSQLALWQSMSLPVVPVSVNLSPLQFRQVGLPEQILQIAREAGVSPELLNLEITESASMEDVAYTQKILTQLREAGVSISIDDFGTGYSSLSYLKRFPINYLKIDISFVREIGSDPETLAIVQAIIGLAKNLHLKTIAEGVETEEQRRILTKLGADYLQGYLMSKPIDPPTVTSVLKEQGIRHRRKFSASG